METRRKTSIKWTKHPITYDHWTVIYGVSTISPLWCTLCDRGYLVMFPHTHTCLLHRYWSSLLHITLFDIKNIKPRSCIKLHCWDLIFSQGGTFNWALDFYTTVFIIYLYKCFLPNIVEYKSYGQIFIMVITWLWFWEEGEVWGAGVEVWGAGGDGDK